MFLSFHSYVAKFLNKRKEEQKIIQTDCIILGHLFMKKMQKPKYKIIKKKKRTYHIL